MSEKNLKNIQDMPLESRVFMIVLVVGTLTAFLSTCFTAVEGLGIGATLSTLACLLVLIVIGVMSFVFKMESICHVLLCLVLNVVMLPITFYFCGGIKSGMTLYFMTSLYVVVPTIARRRTRIIVYLISLTSLLLTVVSSYIWLPHFVVPVNRDAWRVDELMSLLLNAGCIFLVASLTVNAYQKEREENERLVAQLADLAIRDELTGLYNRRELFRMLEDDVMTAPNDDLHCMFIFDVDDFKKVNDTFGHVFGDKVLCEVAHCLQEAVGTMSKGEIAARYSGEEFIAVFHDADFDTSYARAERVRQEVEKLRFYENPEFRVTISGGVDRCNSMRPRYALRQVDDLLFLAKSTGKNQITRKM